MKNTLKITTLISLLLAVLMCVSVLTACGNTGAGDTTTASANATGNAGGDDAESDAQTEYDPFDTIEKFNDTFTYLAWIQNDVVEYYGDEESGDMIKSAVFKRNALVSDRLGVTLEFIEEKGSSGDYKNFCSNATNNISSGSHAYDAIACYTRAASLLMIQNSLLNLLSNETQLLDFSNPWWPASLTQLNTIGGKLYFASGDIATSLLYQMMFMCVNKGMATNFGIEDDIQQIAKDGGWTLDKMFEYSKDRYLNDDSDEKHSVGDRYGLFTIGHNMLDTFYIGAGLKYVDINNDGEANISADVGSDISYDIQARLRNIFWQGSTADGYFSSSGSDWDIGSSGNSLFYVLNGTTLNKYLRGASFEYGILCAPKYNTDQDNYYTAVGFPHSMYCIPYDADNVAMSSAVLELTARESYKKVTPVVFETAFKYRYGKTAIDADMFEIIRSGVVFDLGRTLFDQLGGDDSSPIRLWRNEIVKDTNNFASVVKSYSDQWEKKLDGTIAEITKRD